MIIWNGKGGFVFLIVFITSLSMELLTEGIYGDETFYQSNDWPLAMCFFISAFFTYLLSNYLNSQPERTLIDKETKKEIIIKPNHKLFFIDIKYWPVILIIIGLVVLFYN